MKKKLICLVMTCIVLLWPSSAFAAATDYSIILSNIGGGTGTVPADSRTLSITGKNVNGYALMRLEDFAYLGATVSVNPSNTDEWRIQINGQTIKFTNGSTSFTSTTPYTIYNPSTGSNVTYNLVFSGTTEVPAQIIDGGKYVRLTAAANQSGALLVSYISSLNATKVYHWRVNGTSPYSDSNTYIVGGPWVTSWSSKGTTAIAPHFTISEFRDSYTSSSDPAYYYQLKVSKQQLTCAENVRYNYNANSSMTINSGFRSWKHNKATSGSWDKSFHMRGRAWDASNTNSIYTKVYNEFKGTNTAPTDISVYWRTTVSNGLSQGYEIEKMPSGGSTWLHLQTQPAYGSNM